MAAEQLKLPAADLELRGTEVVSKTDATKKVALGQIQAFGRRGLLVGIGYRVPNPPGSAVNPFGVQFAEVEVNTKTGEIKVLRFLAAHDSADHEREDVPNQVFGGVTMGIVRPYRGPGDGRQAAGKPSPSTMTTRRRRRRRAGRQDVGGRRSARQHVQQHRGQGRGGARDHPDGAGDCQRGVPCDGAAADDAP
jgi:hypothetical protein